MCDKCERDKGRIIDHRYAGTICVNTDRLAVLERDHLAMERLRKGDINLLEIIFDVPGNYCWNIEKSGSKKNLKNDPADAILSVKEE